MPSVADRRAATAGADRRLNLWLSVGLFALTLLLFLPNAVNQFSQVDDDLYVQDNAMVKQGLTPQSVWQAFTTSDYSNWLPLTTLSHMATAELFGMNPVAHHLVNIVLHAINAALAFFAVKALTGRRWTSWVVALLFAVHPQRVESVGWVAERKDVLSGTFFFLLLLAYASYANCPGWRRYGIVLLALAAGLMSKTMLVTAPFLLLLLDVWPMKRASLGRFGPEPLATGDAAAGRSENLGPVLKEPRPSGSGGVGSTSTSRITALDHSAPSRSRLFQSVLRHSLGIDRVGWGRLLVEKLPMLAMVAAASVWTSRLQEGGGAVEMTAELSLGQRVANAVVCAWRYVGKLLLPFDLSPFYIHPRSWPTAMVALAALGFAVATLWACLLFRRRPYLLVGWCWFLGMLFPVSGVLVQPGRQSMDDRYSYLPTIGLVIAFVWLAADAVARRAAWRRPLAIATALVVVGLSAATVRYQALWQNDSDLYEYAIHQDPNNWFAHMVVARIDRSEGIEQRRPELIDQSIEHFQRSLAVEPTNYFARLDYATVLLISPHRDRATLEQAEAEFRTLVNRTPTPSSCIGLAKSLDLLGRGSEADAVFADAHKRWPRDTDVLGQWSMSLLKRGDRTAAHQRAAEALQIDPTNEIAQNILSSSSPP